MNGKIVKVSSNDLYGNADERLVSIFAVFNHKKYMNKYIIFSFLGEYNKKQLYYGSIHLKSDSIVVFAIKETEVKYIDDFTTQYLNQTLDNNEYEIIDISNINKIELVSYNNKDSEELEKLDELSIKKIENKETEEIKSKTSIILYLILFILFIALIGVSILYFYPEVFTIKNKMLTCTKDIYSEKLSIKYTSIHKILFDHDDKLKSIGVTETYIFKDEETYLNYKNESSSNTDNTYNFIDEELKVDVTYEEKSIIENYNEMYSYMKKEGYSCIEETYEE